MPFYRCGGGSNKVKLVTVNVSATDFPELFKYIDERAGTYHIASADKKIVSISYEIVNTGGYSSSSISFRDYSKSENKLYINAPSTAESNTVFNGLTIYMYSTTADGDLHFNKLSYTYILT